jgi:hypothetical protein
MANPLKGRADHLVVGDWNAVCSMCGRKRKATELVQNWQGMWRCPECNEPRQPQDFVRGIADIITPPFVQPPESIYIEICTFNGISAIPLYAIPGCSIPGRTQISPDVPAGPLPPPAPPTTYFLVTESGTFLVTELGTFLVTQ